MKGPKCFNSLLMTTDTVGGVWTYCMDLCRFLQPYGVHIHLVTMGGEMKDWQREEVAALNNVTVHETSYQLEWMQAPWADLEACGAHLLQLEAALQPDVVHLNCFAYGTLPFNAPVLVVAHSDVYSWFLAVKGEAPDAAWQPYFHCVQKGLQSADLVIAPSRAMLDYAETIYGVSGNRQVIYNGRNRALFYKREKIRFVFSMGRVWDEAKNIQLLLSAAPHIHAPIKIAGDNTFEQSHIALAQNGIEYLGKLSTGKVAAILSEAAVYVLPAKYEPFGLSAVEAGLSGCALVLGNISSLREVWGDAALYVDTDDENTLAATVNHLLEDEALLKDYSNRAKERAQQYAAETMAQQYMMVYKQLLQKEKQTILTELV
mgnify:FL=1